MKSLDFSKDAALIFGDYLTAHYNSYDFGNDIIIQAKKCLLDTMGCIIAGSSTPSGKISAKVAKQLSSKKESYIFASSWSSAENAAMANGTMAHSLEFDDSMYGHTGSVIIPTAFAVGEKCKSSGKEIISAINLGYEIFGRIGKILNKPLAHSKGFHPTSLAAPFGAAAAASFLLKLNSKEVASAFGIAGSQSGGLMEFLNDGSWTKRFHPGWGAHSGIIASILAKNGFKGPVSILEGHQGFFRTFLGKTITKEELCDNLFDKYLISQNSFKVFGCCRQIHSTLTAVKEILATNPFEANEIKEIKCFILEDGFNMVARPHSRVYEPKNIVDAQFSLPFNLAYLILNSKKKEFHIYSEEVTENRDYLALAKKIKAYPNREFDKAKAFLGTFPAEVTVLLRSGQEYKARVEAPLGHPKNPVSFEILREKFRTLLKMAVNRNIFDEIIDSILNIENIPNAANYFAKIVNRGFN